MIWHRDTKSGGAFGPTVHLITSRPHYRTERYFVWLGIGWNAEGEWKYKEWCFWLILWRVYFASGVFHVLWLPGRFFRDRRLLCGTDGFGRDVIGAIRYYEQRLKEIRG
jgi:hypothetical protein